jgi:hypothetical protein
MRQKRTRIGEQFRVRLRRRIFGGMLRCPMVRDGKESARSSQEFSVGVGRRAVLRPGKR